MQLVPHPSLDEGATIAALSPENTLEVISSFRTQRERQLYLKRQHELANLRTQHKKAMIQFETSKSELLQYIAEGGAQRVPPHAVADVIAHLESCIRIQKNRNIHLGKHIAISRLNQNAAQQKLQYVLEDIAYLEGQSGLTCERIGLIDSRPHQEIHTEITDLRKRIEIAQRELHHAQLLEAKKGDVLQELTHQVEARKEFNEELYQLKNEYRVTVYESITAAQRLEQLRMVHEDTDRRIRTLLNSRDLVPVNSLHSDLTFLRTEKDALEGDVAHQIRLIAAQRYRIETLRHRLNCFYQCLQDVGLWENVQSSLNRSLTDSASTQEITPDPAFTSIEVVPSDEQVPIEMLELAQASLAELERCVALKDILVAERENAVESIGQKVDSILMQRYEDDESRYYEKFDLSTKMERERQELEERELSIRDGLDALNIENARLKRKIVA